MLAYEEFIEFLACGTTPQGIVDFEPSLAAKARVSDLLERQESGQLSEEERDEIEEFLQIEHLMRMAKARARARVSGGE
jgi:hypothetical protein